MAKKDFSGINTGRVYAQLEQVTADNPEPQAETKPGHKKYKDRRTYTDEEAQEAMLSMSTSGKKGVKLPRINMAFAPDVYDYCKTMSQVRGEPLTKFVNYVLRQSMNEHMDVYEKALEFRNSL